MTKIICFLILLFKISSSYAQSSEVRVKLSRPDKPIIIHMENISADIIGYDGNEVIITPSPLPMVSASAAAGLKNIPVWGRDKVNQFVAPQIKDDSIALRVNIPMQNINHLTIKVPKTAIVYLQIMSYIENSKLTIGNINDLSINGTIPQIYVTNVSGFLINTGGYRETNKIVLSNIKWTDKPVMINGKFRPCRFVVSSIMANIFLTVPDSLKATITFSSQNGEIFSNLNSSLPSVTRDKYIIDEDFPKETNNIHSINVNGGGTNIVLGSNYGNIYLKRAQ